MAQHEDVLSHIEIPAVEEGFGKRKGSEESTKDLAGTRWGETETPPSVSCRKNPFLTSKPSVYKEHCHYRNRVNRTGPRVLPLDPVPKLCFRDHRGSTHVGEGSNAHEGRGTPWFYSGPGVAISRRTGVLDSESLSRLHPQVLRSAPPESSEVHPLVVSFPNLNPHTPVEPLTPLNPGQNPNLIPTDP